ncbi:MAG: hypothetical protein J6V76_03795, partial [Bacteroidales bacterium]|nr:hypothetical protein [Bacteroidales bacterium]
FIDDDNKVLLSNAASGFKSVVPICILTQYYINGGNYITIKDKQRVEELKKLIEHFYSGQDDVIKNINGNINSIISNRNCNIFLEEPEANIFPETQFQLVKWLIASLENGHNNTLSIATHSPYILTVLNNLIYAAKVGKKFPEKINKIISKKMWLPTENVAAYYLNDGTAMNIVDDELGEIDPELIDRISQVINHEYGTIRNIEYERDERRRTA